MIRSSLSSSDFKNHVAASPCMLYNPNRFGCFRATRLPCFLPMLCVFATNQACFLKSVEAFPKLNAVAEPPLHAYSHSASVGNQ